MYELGRARNTKSSGGLGLQEFKSQFTWKPTENFLLPRQRQEEYVGKGDALSLCVCVFGVCVHGWVGETSSFER